MMQFEDACFCTKGNCADASNAQKFESADKLLKEENVCQFDVNVYTERRILRS